MGTPVALLTVLVLLLTGCEKNNGTDPPTDKPNTGDLVLVWSDEFIVNGLPDAGKWSYDTEGNAGGWGNNESQWYTQARQENAEVKDGFYIYFTFKNEDTGYKAWPFDKRFHLLLNVAVGGNWGGAQGVDNTIFPRQMVVDYVRIYQ